MTMVEQNPENLSRAEMVVGILSDDNATALSSIAQQADKALALYYGGLSAVVVACNDHDDGKTRQAFIATRTRVPKVFISGGNGTGGAENNLIMLLRKAVDFSARAVTIVDAGGPRVSPQRIRNLGIPLFQDYHFVAPLYQRTRKGEPFTGNLTYPLTRALYGRRVRQPMPEEFGISGHLARVFLESGLGDATTETKGLAIGMTTMAVHSKVPVIQSFIGGPDTHRPRESPGEEEAEFKEVVASIFELAVRYQEFWTRVRWSRPTAVFGTRGQDGDPSPSQEIDAGAKWERMNDGMHRHWNLCSRILHPDNLNELETLVGLPVDRLVLPSALWARIVFDFCAEYKRRTTPAEDLLDAFLAIYYARTLSFMLETQEMDANQVEQYIEDQCLIFEKTKPYLMHRWFFQ